MFQNVLVRFALRSALVGLAAGVASLQASSLGSDLTQAELITAVLAAFSAALSYAGVGALIPQVEPSVGRKMEA